MKIRKVIIKDYKVFDDIEFDFTDHDGNTLDTIVLAGVNGSGKTSLLELFAELFSGDEHSGLSCESVQIELEKHPDDTSLFKTNSPFFQLIYKPRKSDTDSNIDKNDFRDFVTSASIVYIPAETYINIKWSGWGSESIQEGFVRKLDFRKRNDFDIERYIVTLIIRSVLKGREEKAGNIIKNITSTINSLLSDIKFYTKLIDITPEKPVFESPNGKQISIQDLSGGEKQLFYRAVYLQSLNLHDSIIMVDEPETSLHPTWQQEISKLYQNVGSHNQVIIATHSPQVIASVKPESLFLLAVNEETHKIEVMNMAKAGKQTKGLEPNRILKEIMGTPLRDYETEQRIDHVTDLLRLHPEAFEQPETLKIVDDLIKDLGRQDPFIIRLEHQLLMQRRKQEQRHAIHSEN